MGAVTCILFYSMQYFAGAAIAFQRRVALKSQGILPELLLNPCSPSGPPRHRATRTRAGTFAVTTHLERSTVTAAIASWRPADSTLLGRGTAVVATAS